MKSLWTGAVSFGLINIPVKIFPAVQESSLDLDMLDPRDHSRIHYKRINEHTGKEVPYEDIVKGYKLNGKYVLLDDEDFERADVKRTKTIEILEFVDEEEIDSMYYEQPYYLEPDKSGHEAYALLRDALAAAKKVGVTTFVLRNREALAILKPKDKVIVLNRIRFEEEIRDSKELQLPSKSSAHDKKQQMAKQLIDEHTGHFDISSYKDTYSANLLKIIKEKSKGKKRPVQKLTLVKPDASDDLMAMLKASLSKKRRAS